MYKKNMVDKFERAARIETYQMIYTYLSGRYIIGYADTSLMSVNKSVCNEPISKYEICNKQITNQFRTDYNRHR